METDRVSVINMPNGIIVLNNCLLARTNKYKYSGNNHYNGDYTVVVGKHKNQKT